MSNVLSEQTKQQVIALGRLGWSLRRIEQELGVRRETASTYLKAAGILVQPPGRRREGAGPKPAISVSPVTTDSEPAKPALGESASDPDPGRAAPPVTASSSAIRRAQPTRLSGSDPSPSASVCEPFREAIELVEEFAKSVNQREWDIFQNGTPEQIRALQDAIACEMYGEEPYHLTPDESGAAEPLTDVGTAVSQHESELHEARVRRALDKAGVKGASGWNPEAVAQALREEGVDAEWRNSQDGKVGGILIFGPAGRERSENYIDFLFGPANGGREQS